MIIRMLLAAALGWLAAASPARAADAAPPITAEAVAAFFDTAFDVQRQDHRIAGAVVAVVYRGEVLFLGGYGWADIDGRVPADPRRSLFRIASITKPFVWTALMQLAEQGELDLDDPVTPYLDFDIPGTFEEPIRIRHLMSHTAGFEELATGTAARSADGLRPLRDYLVDGMPRRVRPPGQHAAYSNYGSALAGYVVERITGQDWSEYLDARIFAPLGMTATTARDEMTAALRARHAISYRYRAGRFEPIDYLYVMDRPAGQISTTAADMARFMLAHLGDGSAGGGRILQPASVRTMREPLFEAHPELPPILHGFFRSDRNGQVVYGHGGDVNGFHSNLSLLPERALGVFVAFNADPASTARAHLVDAFVDHFFPVTYLGDPVAPATRQIARYAGEYLPLRRNVSTFERLGSLIMSLDVAVDGPELLVSAGNGSGRWVPTGDGVFRARYGDASLAFVTAAQDAGGDAAPVLYLGSSLASFERVSGMDRPSVLRALFAATALICALAVLGWGYRAVRPAEPAVSLPRADIAVGWLYAALTVYLLVQLATALMGDVEEFQFGVPPQVDRALTMMSGNLVLAVLVVLLAARQWLRGKGSMGSRLRYALVAVAAAMSLWLAWYFNYALYALRLIAGA